MEIVLGRYREPEVLDGEILVDRSTLMVLSVSRRRAPILERRENG